MRLTWHDGILALGLLVVLAGFALTEVMRVSSPFLIVVACGGAALSLWAWLIEVWRQWENWRHRQVRL